VVLDAFPWVTGTEPPTYIDYRDVPQIAALLKLVELIPDQLLRCPPPAYGSLIQVVATIQHMVNLCTNVPNGKFPWLLVDRMNVITRLWQILSDCPDDAASEETPKLQFIDSEALRDSVRLDLSASETALNHGEWKAATILAGAVVEALLLWAVDRHTQAERALALQNAQQHGARVRKLDATSPENWHLPDLIEAGLELSEISAQSAAQARIAKDFRNLIHPGKARRENVKCDRGTALAAFAAAHLVVRDLESQRKNTEC
jgi:hypothetical protein